MLSMWDFKPLLSLIKTRLLGVFGLWEWGGCEYWFKAEIWSPPPPHNCSFKSESKMVASCDVRL